MNLLDQHVKHKTLGLGTVIAQDDKYITVEFASKTSRFPYPRPDTFTKFLRADDPAIQDAILQEIEEEKRAKEATCLAAEEAKRRAEEAKQKAEEEARAAEQARKEAEAASKKPRIISAASHVAPESVPIPGKPMTFYVFQGSTFDSESLGGFIWAPQHDQNGRSKFHWDNMTKVKKGDIILHGCDAKVVAVSTAVSDCYECDRPKESTFEDAWIKDGYRVDLKYLIFRNPIRTQDFVSSILEFSRAKYSPFNRYGTGNMGYLFEINRELARVFLAAAVRINPELSDVDYIQELLTEEVC